MIPTFTFRQFYMRRRFTEGAFKWCIAYGQAHSGAPTWRAKKGCCKETKGVIEACWAKEMECLPKRYVCAVDLCLFWPSRKAGPSRGTHTHGEVWAPGLILLHTGASDERFVHARNSSCSNAEPEMFWIVRSPMPNIIRRYWPSNALSGYVSSRGWSLVEGVSLFLRTLKGGAAGRRVLATTTTLRTIYSCVYILKPPLAL